VGRESLRVESLVKFDGELVNYYTDPTRREKIVLKCSVCRCDLQTYELTGAFGCSNCYNVFEDYVKKIIKELK